MIEMSVNTTFGAFAALSVMDNSDVDVKIIVSDDNDCEVKRDVQSQEKHLQIPNSDAEPMPNNNLLNRVKNQRSRSLDPANFLIEFERRQRRGSSISSLGNWTGAVIVSEAIDSSDHRSGKWYI